MILLFWLLHSSNHVLIFFFFKANSKDFVHCKIMSGGLGITEFHNVTT